MNRKLRSLLVLGRVSNLPTVWTNCLAGWLLGGRGRPEHLPLLLIGATLLYEAGMFLNDAFDVAFDTLHRSERPIPSGQLSARSVWISGFALAALGLALLFSCGVTSGLLSLALLAAILFYDWLHKKTGLAPLLMGLCRWLLYLVAASTATQGITVLSVWAGFGLGCYVVGLSYFARRESSQGVVGFWPLLPLLAPIVIAFLLNDSPHRQDMMLLSLILILWTARSLRFALWSPDLNIGKAVSGLLAGIVLVDWLAIAGDGREFGLLFIGMLFLALLLQRVAPAT